MVRYLQTRILKQIDMLYNDSGSYSVLFDTMSPQRTNMFLCLETNVDKPCVEPRTEYNKNIEKKLLF